MSPDKVFVYGTLKRGFSRFNTPALEAIRTLIVPATVRGELFSLGAYPALKLNPQGGLVKGEVHTFHPIKRALAVLDGIEGYFGRDHPLNLFHRIEVTAQIEGGGESVCWVYEYAGSVADLELLPRGEWVGPKI